MKRMNKLTKKRVKHPKKGTFKSASVDFSEENTPDHPKVDNLKYSTFFFVIRGGTSEFFGFRVFVTAVPAFYPVFFPSERPAHRKM